MVSTRRVDRRPQDRPTSPQAACNKNNNHHYKGTTTGNINQSTTTINPFHPRPRSPHPFVPSSMVHVGSINPRPILRLRHRHLGHDNMIIRQQRQILPRKAKFPLPCSQTPDQQQVNPTVRGSTYRISPVRNTRSCSSRSLRTGMGFRPRESRESSNRR